MNDFFRWDHLKDLSHRAKHVVGFHEASSVFYDDHARLMTDPDHLVEEDRFVILGMSSSMRILVVVHSYRQKDEVIGIISARKATKSEARHYTGDQT
jgi:uncharacterized DUF497 family protein